MSGCLNSQKTQMTKDKVFPTLLIVLDVLAAIFYIPKWPDVLYWLFAAGLPTIVVYFK